MSESDDGSLNAFRLWGYICFLGGLSLGFGFGAILMGLLMARAT